MLKCDKSGFYGSYRIYDMIHDIEYSRKEKTPKRRKLGQNMQFGAFAEMNMDKK